MMPPVLSPLLRSGLRAWLGAGWAATASSSQCSCSRTLHACSSALVESSTSASSATAAASTEAALAAASTSAPSLAQEAIDSIAPRMASTWMYRAVKQKNNMSTAEWLEHNRKGLWSKITFWEKFYYAAGLLGGSALLFNYLDLSGVKAKKAEIDRQRAEETEAKRLQALPRYLSGKSFADEEDDSDDLSDVFEGASPKEIEELLAKYRAQQAQAGATRWAMPAFLTESDPFDGMSPEEIDAYMQRKKKKQQ